MGDMAKVLDCLNKIDTANNYLMSLVNDILDMSRIESGKLDLHPEDMDLAELLEKIEIMMLLSCMDLRW